MSKKKLEEIQKEKQTFIEGDPERNICGAVATGISRKIAGQIYDSIIPFAGYGFNKPHAVAYAMIAYQTAYMKCHYPNEYMAALISSVLGQPESVAMYAAECNEMGIRLLPPDINESYANFTVSGNDIRYGLVAVKNIGRGFINEVTAERDENGKFKSFEDFCKRMYGGDLNRRALESLIKCGCFDGLGANRRQLMMICQTVIDSVVDHNRRNVEGQIDLFGMSDDEESKAFGTIELPDIPDYSKGELTRMEREVTGLYLSGHPMDEYRDAVKRLDAVYIGDVLADFAFTGENDIDNITPGTTSDTVNNNISKKKFKDNQKVVLTGIVESVKTKPTRNNTLMAYVTIEDGTGSIELLAFQRVLDESGIYMQIEAPVIAYGKISERDDKEPQILLDTFRPISDAANMTAPGSQKPKPTGKTLYVKLHHEESPEYNKLKQVHAMFPGHERMIIHFEDTKKNVGASCMIHEAFITELNTMLGPENIVVR